MDSRRGCAAGGVCRASVRPGSCKSRINGCGCTWRWNQRKACWYVGCCPAWDRACFAAFLKALRTELADERVGIVLDNAPSHHSKQVVWPDGFVPLRLPPYSPELNPAEQVFHHPGTRWVKRLANQVFDDLAALHAALTQALEELWTQPQIVVRLTAYPWWAKGMQANIPLAS